MRTDPECAACLLRQALSTARLSTTDPEILHLVVKETVRLLTRLDMSASPPENAVAGLIMKKEARNAQAAD
ncbi:MAG: hypothetical protein M8357_05885 [Desulfobulbaceae bacterium]|nr:hypothetical protein [Desulfobulbaceae bacterium]